jgi:3-oxoacyl-[acyl-carrier-protein] synthase-3
MSRPPAPIAAITGLGTAVPVRVVPNAEFEAYLDTSDQWIQERTGIRERRIAGPGETLTALCRAASERALARAGRTAAELDAIILGTITPDHRLPSTACELQAALGADRAAAFDIAAACPGWIYALAVAEGLIASGRARTVLALGAEKLSSVTDWNDRSTAVLFGDGAGAAVVQPAPGDGRGILSIVLGADGKLADLLKIPGGGSCDPVSAKVVQEGSQYIKMAGREVFKAAVHTMAKACDQALAQAGVNAEEIDLLVPHQANLRIIEATAKHAGVPMSKVMVNVDRYGNTSAASIQIAIDQALAEGRVRTGSLLLLVTFGAGFTWGAAVVRW